MSKKRISKHPIQDENLAQFKVYDASYSLPYYKSHNDTKNEILMTATIMFAQNGYASVSMRNIAEKLGITAGSLYNHFGSKELLWKEVMEHTKELYLLFCKHMQEEVKKATSFEEVLQVLFAEPEKMDNHFTCYAFALAFAEQFRDDYARNVYHNYLLKYAIDFVKEEFDACIQKGWVEPFDTWIAACMYSHSVLLGVNISVHKLMGNPTAYDDKEIVTSMHQFILNSVKINPPRPKGESKD